MEILIDDIPDEGLEINATESNAWLSSIMKEILGSAFEKGGKALFNVSLTKFDDNVNLDGIVDITAGSDCDRCLRRYEEAAKVPIHAVLSPLHHRHREEYDDGTEEELVKEDLEFEFYEGDRFDLAEIVREQMLLALPMKHLCREDCLGLCQGCGKNLNDGSCKCVQKKPDTRWPALKNIKMKVKKKSRTG